MFIHRITILQKYYIQIMVEQCFKNVDKITWMDDDILQLENYRLSRPYRGHYYEFSITMLSNAVYKLVCTKTSGGMVMTYDDWSNKMFASDQNPVDYLYNRYKAWMYGE